MMQVMPSDPASPDFGKSITPPQPLDDHQEKRVDDLEYMPPQVWGWI
jgi:hypothetical protein